MQNPLVKQDDALSLNLTDEPLTFASENLDTDLQNWLLQSGLVRQGCRPLLTTKSKHGGTEHFTFAVSCKGLPLLGSTWHLHLYDNHLVMVSESSLWQEQKAAIEASLLFSSPHPNDQIITQQLGLAPDSLQEAWEQQVRTGQTGQIEARLVDRGTGKIMQRQARHFDAVTFEAYAVNQLDAKLESVTLPTQSSGFLDSPAGFRVYGGDRQTTRLPVDSLRSNVRYDGVITPDDPSHRTYFDQLQAFYTLDRAVSWFHDNFGYELGSAGIDIFTASMQDGTPNNARYVPASGSASSALILGAGDGQTYRNLGRDTDVIYHEFSHHILHRTMKAAYGETGILHEGTADYFAYAINGDPYLGESVKIGAPFIRTAKLAESDRFDLHVGSDDPHDLGQYWSALLWTLREEVGATTMDSLVYHAIDYLPAAASLGDFFAALLSVDRDLYPDRGGSLRSADAIGTHHCLILQRAVERGFSGSLGTLNGDPCDLDLIALSAASRQLQQDLNSEREALVADKEQSSSDSLLKGCGVVGEASANSFFTGWWFALPLLLGPFFQLTFATAKSANTGRLQHHSSLQRK